METPGERKVTLSVGRCGLASAKGVSRDQASCQQELKRNTIDSPLPQGKVGDYTDTFRFPRFQYKYPGTPTSTIAVPQNASEGRVMIVFSVHAPPINT